MRTRSRYFLAPRQPLLWAAGGFAAGLGFGAYAWRPAGWWLISAVLLLLGGFPVARARSWMAAAMALGAMFAVGALTVEGKSAPDTNGVRLPEFADGTTVLVTAHVTAGETRRPESNSRREALDLETEQVTAGGEALAVHSGIRMSFYSKGAEDGAVASTPRFSYGQRLRFPARLYAPRNFRNPGAFDYRQYLADEGVSALGSAKIESVEMLPGLAGSAAERWRALVYRRVSDRIYALWPRNEAALMGAMLLGDESGMSRSSLLDFQRTGTYHVLVISGLKVGILSLATLLLLRRLRLSDAVAGGVALLLTVAYALLTGVGAPVWRATLMLAVYCAARALYRERATLNALGAAALALLLFDPAQLSGASFQLSFLCVWIIAAIALPLMERTTQPALRAARHLESVNYDVAHAPRLAQMRLDLRMIAGRLGRFVGQRCALFALSGGGRMFLLSFEFVLISTVLQAGFALPMAFYFHRANVTSLPGNIVAVPLTEIILVAGGLAVALSGISHFLAMPMVWLAGSLLETTAATVRWLGHLRVSELRVATLGPALALGAGAALVLAMLLARRRPVLAAAGIAGLVFSAVWIAIAPGHARFEAGRLEVTAIDVGQGDSILAVSPQGRTLLMDAGGTPGWMHSELDIGEDVVSPYLWWRGIRRLDVAAVTHAHADHIGGMMAVLENFRPRELWIGVNDPSAELQVVLRRARELGIPVVSHLAGDRFELGGAWGEVLAPAGGREPPSRRNNDESLVVKLSYGKTSALLEGDAERATESRLAEAAPQADLLKVAHHGSATSTSEALLRAVQPRFAVISVGARNAYGHPRREVLQRLQASGTATFRTDLDGAVSFFLDGKGVRPGVAGLR